MPPSPSLKLAKVILIVVMLCLAVASNRDFEQRSSQAWKFERWYEKTAAPGHPNMEVLKKCQLDFKFNSREYSLTGQIDGSDSDKFLRLLSLFQNSNLLSLEKARASNYLKLNVPVGTFIASFDAADIKNNTAAQNLIKLLEIYENQKRSASAAK